ncbi:CDP-archaeol synthase [Motiliproteus sp. MSK22-1]|uniref:CDP-archaeol synthase n=1 Tax=Motiliproteus sp. MSK22-1 TaxID=1897630 RepID=UPI000977E8AF|nr:CDP-archaeol synthase [Motiliproteus sp. MSK22-1]OMH39004.1 hypothetical protein BGP75_04575 [Motiliproteus sp. MSK22-1]
MLELQLLALLLITNGLPILGNYILGPWNSPLDSGYRLIDGQYLLGPSKSWGGLLFSISLTPLAASIMGHGVLFGLYFALAAMAGDLISSFLKRRLKLPSSARCYGIDQIPESFLPLIVSCYYMKINSHQVVLIMLIFIIAAVLLSRLLYLLNIKNRPY